MYKKNTHTKAFPVRDLHGMAFKPKPLARAFRFMLMASINVEKEVLAQSAELSKTNLNYSINGYDGQTVIDLVKEKKKRVRSDRKVYFNLSVPCPDTIPKERHDEFTLDHTIEIKTYEK